MEQLTVAAAQPALRDHDLAHNVQQHAEVVGSAGARLVLFPELSLTGYQMSAGTLQAVDDPGLQPLMAACAAAGAVALAGAPVVDDGGSCSIATVRVDADGARVVYRKSWLGDAEGVRFRPGPGPVVIDVDGWRVGLGICKDTGSMQHVAATAALDLDLYCAGLVHRPEELPEQDARGWTIARAGRCHVLFASYAGATGDVFSATAGHSTLWDPDGTVRQRADERTGRVVAARIDRRVRRMAG